MRQQKQQSIKDTSDKEGYITSMPDIKQNVSDEILIVQYSQGDVSAFECLYARHKKGVMRFLQRQCNNHSVAEELVHDTWVAVIKQSSNYQQNAKFVTWLYRIAHNRLVDYWRKHGSSAKVFFDEVSDSILSNTMDAHQVDSNDQAFDNLVLEDLFACLGKLSSEQLETLLLKIEGFSYAEISDITQAGHETVKSRLRYATQHLRVSTEVCYD